MRFLTKVALLTTAVVLIAKAGKTRKTEVADEQDPEEDVTPEGSQPYADRTLYAEPSALTVPERHEGDFDSENRPEYSSDNQPQLTVEALRRETNDN